MTRESRAKELDRFYAKHAKADVKAIVEDVIDLYVQGKIVYYETARGLLHSITSTIKKVRDRGIADFKKKRETYAKTEPAIGRLERETKRYQTQNMARFDLEYLAYKRVEAEDYNKTEKTRRKKMNGMLYVQRGSWRKAIVMAPDPFPSDLYKKHIPDMEEDGKFNDKFGVLLAMLQTDDNVARYYKEAQSDMPNMFYIEHSDILTTRRAKYDPTKAKAKSAGAKTGIRYKYTSTELDVSQTSFKLAIEKKNYVENECWLNSFIDFYKNLFSVERQEPLTRESLLHMIGKTEENIKQGLCIDEMIPIFVALRLALRVYDYKVNLIFKYDPKVRNRHQKAMYVLQHDGHIYTMNHNLKQLAQKLEQEHKINVQVSSDYAFQFQEDDEDVSYKMFRHVDDILDILRDDDGETDTFHLIHKENNLNKVYWQLHDSGYLPTPKFDGGQLSRLHVEVNGVDFYIKNQQLIKDNGLDGFDIYIEDEQTYNNTYRANKLFNKTIFDRKHLSYYSQQDIDVLDECGTLPQLGVLRQNLENKKLAEIDVCKAYTAALKQISRVPVFNEFDVMKPYDGGEIEDMTLYVVRDKGQDVGLKLFLQRTENLAYGQFLKQLKEGDVEILYSKKPSGIFETGYSDAVDTLYKTELYSDDYKEYLKGVHEGDMSKVMDEEKYLKKMIANITIGLMGKVYNRKCETVPFADRDSADEFQAKYGGLIRNLREVKEQEDEWDPEEWFDFDVLECYRDNDGTHCDDGRVFPLDDKRKPRPILRDGERLKEIASRTHYIAYFDEKAKLTNGFRYVKELVLQTHNFRMYQDLKKLKENKIPVFTVKTDAFTIQRSHVDRARQVLEFGAEIGCWRNSKNEHITPQTKPHQVIENKPLEIVAPTCRRIELKDEWDNDEIAEHFIKEKRCIVRAKMPGSGKSKACTYMRKKGYKVLVICPTNKLMIDFLEDGMACTTFDSFFNISFNDVKGVKKKKEPYDFSPYDCFVFDEIYFKGNPKALIRVKRFIEEHPEFIVLATGDPNQLHIEEEDCAMTDDQWKTYTDECLNLIFKNEIYLHHNKRLEYPQDREKLAVIYEDIFVKKMRFEDIIDKHFKWTDAVNQCEHNVALTNDQCVKVSNSVRKSQNKKEEYYVGEILISRDYIRTSSDYAFKRNFEYEIVQVADKYLMLKEVHSDEVHSMDIEKVRKSFIFRYCCTVYSMQGITLKHKKGEAPKTLNIFEWNHYYMKRKHLWVALTRVVGLANVYFYRHQDDSSKDEELMQKYFKRKVEGYVQQDRADNRPVDKESYVDVDWFMTRKNLTCYYCPNDFNISIDRRNNRVKTDITAERLDNSRPHIKDNCRLCCLHCNISKK